jgi:hypothetical protein
METEIASVLDDPRWHAFNSEGFACSCGERHVGLFPINLQVPMGWPGPKEYENDSALRTDGNFLSHNLCVWDGKYFSMRMRLPLVIKGAMPHAFMYTVWASVDKVDFDAYLEAKREGKMKNDARARARLVNRVSGFENTGSLMGTAFQQEDLGLPVLIIHGLQPGLDSNHRLIKEQKNGIGMDRVLELFAAYDHDMRPKA